MADPLIRQSAGNGAAASLNNITQALGSAVLQGSRLTAYIVWGEGTTASAVLDVSDTINGTTGWVRIAASNAKDTGGPTQAEWWTNPNSAAGAAPTVTVRYANGSGVLTAQPFRAVIFQEITNSDPNESAAAILVAVKDQTTTTLSMVSNSITTLVARCLVMGSCSNDTNTVAPTAGAGYTIDKTTTGQTIATEWQTQAAKGAITAAFTFGTAAAGVIQIIAFKPAPTYFGTDLPHSPQWQALIAQ